MSYCLIPCDLHDHLEIACMANAELRIELRSGEVYVATPVTTHIESDEDLNQAEWLECREAGHTRRIRLDWIRAFEPTTQVGLFERVELP